MFDFQCVVLPPSSGGVTTKQLQMFESVDVPTAKGFDDEGFEDDALGPAIVEMLANLRGFSHVNGGGRSFGGA